MNNEVTIVEPICYLYPHKEELVATSDSMKGVWRITVGLIKKDKNSVLAPLLVDDINRSGFKNAQTVDDILGKTLSRKYSELTWFGEKVMEGRIEEQYGNLGCKAFDAIYHKDCILSLLCTGLDWKWIVVHPESFKSQQAGMLLNLWNLVSENVSFGTLAKIKNTDKDSSRNEVRDSFLQHFTHYWVNPTGHLVHITKPLYRGGKIIHKEI